MLINGQPAVSVSPLAARPGDTLTYVHPVSRAVRHHPIQAIEWREMERLVDWKRVKGSLLKKAQVKRLAGQAFLLQQHPHEAALAKARDKDELTARWVPVEDVMRCWRVVGATPAPACWGSA